MKPEIKAIIEQLDLQPHPEGGYFKEVYRSNGLIKSESLSTSYNGNRNYCTSIYFLLTSDSFSAFHRIKQDEIWHFYKGSPIKLHVINPSGKHIEYIIGSAIDKAQKPQFVVKGGDWFAAEVIEKESYALVGCTVSPGFSFEDFELPKRKELLNKFPHLNNVITRLTHS